MSALTDLVRGYAPEACSPQALSSNAYDAVAEPLRKVSVYIVDANDVARRLAETVRNMSLDAFIEEFWDRTVGAAHRCAAVTTCVLVFGTDASPLGNHATSVWPAHYALADVRTALLEFVRSGYAPIGRLVVVMHGIGDEPMALRPRDGGVELGPVAALKLCAAPLVAAETDVAVAAWVRANSAAHVLVDSHDTAVFAALLVTSALMRPPRGSLVVATSYVACTTEGRTRLPVVLPQYINVHMATTLLDTIFATRFLQHNVVADRSHSVLLIMLIALCFRHQFMAADWLRGPGGLAAALGAACCAARDRRLPPVLEVDGTAIAVRTSALTSLARALEEGSTARSEVACAAQAARLAFWLARLANAGAVMPDARAADKRTGMSLWGYTPSGTLADAVAVQPVYVCRSAA